jgi:mannose-6-phosphate isomerase-like protein (cupin superfamily)
MRQSPLQYVRRTVMCRFKTKRLPVAPDAIAPDGSDVRILLELDGGTLAHFELAPSETSVAVSHQTVEEIWFFLTGRGEMWRKLGDQEEIVPVGSGVSITIPVGTHFQFRSFGYEPLAAIGIAMPPWPGEDEAYEVKGKWTPTLKPGSG